MSTNRVPEDDKKTAKGKTKKTFWQCSGSVLSGARSWSWKIIRGAARKVSKVLPFKKKRTAVEEMAESEEALIPVELETETAEVRLQKAVKPLKTQNEQGEMTVPEQLAAIEIEVLPENADQKVFIWYCLLIIRGSIGGWYNNI